MTVLSRIAGVPIRSVSPEDAASLVVQWARGGHGHDVHLVNAWTVALADKDPSYAELLDGASANFADGHSLVRVTRQSVVPLQQVRGPSLFRKLLSAEDASLRHFLLGGSPGTLAALEKAIHQQYPGTRIVGVESPPFRELTPAELAEQDARVLASGANIVWVGLGTPKQDFEAQRIARGLPVVAVAIGAAFDFIAGTKREAPQWLRRAHLEWLYRFAAEPRRLWRRYLVGNVIFLRAVARDRSEQLVLRGPLPRR